MRDRQPTANAPSTPKRQHSPKSSPVRWTTQ